MEKVSELNETDHKIIELLGKGRRISQIASELKELKLKPFSVDGINKRINSMMKYYKARNIYQLAIKIQNLKWNDATERLIQNALKDGHEEGVKKGFKAGTKKALLISIPSTMALCGAIYYVITNLI